jgi:hypothetical protein
LVVRVGDGFFRTLLTVGEQEETFTVTIPPQLIPLPR